MSSRRVFSIAAIVTGALGLAFLIAPDFMLAGWGVKADHAIVFMTRRYGAALFGYAVILWFARAAAASPARHAIATGGFVVTAVVAVISLFGVLSGTVGPMAWSAVVIEVLLAAAFGYLLLTEKP
jgi:hypothetical protein